jgi:hypothetical protein
MNRFLIRLVIGLRVADGSTIRGSGNRGRDHQNVEACTMGTAPRFAKSVACTIATSDGGLIESNQFAGAPAGVVRPITALVTCGKTRRTAT